MESLTNRNLGLVPQGVLSSFLPVPVFWCFLLASGPRAVSCGWQVRSAHPAESSVMLQFVGQASPPAEH